MTEQPGQDTNSKIKARSVAAAFIAGTIASILAGYVVGLPGYIIGFVFGAMSGFTITRGISRSREEQP